VSRERVVGLAQQVQSLIERLNNEIDHHSS
jgi:hypothetical protein